MSRRTRSALCGLFVGLVIGGAAAPTSAFANPAVGQAVPSTGTDVGGPGRIVTPSGHRRSPTPPSRRPVKQTPAQRAQSRKIGANAERPSVSSSQPRAAPLPQQSFEGQIAVDDDPPDTHGAIGRNHYVEATNDGITMYSRAGTLLKSVSLRSFFGPRVVYTDPRIVYDKVSNRWVATIIRHPATSRVNQYFVAVSTTGNPTGPYCRYTFTTESSAVDIDYPQLGMNQNAIIITLDVFSSSTDGPLRARVTAFSKASLYNCQSNPSSPIINLASLGTVAPPIVEGANPNTYLLAWDFTLPGRLRLFRCTNLGGSGPSCAQSRVPISPVGEPQAARQPGSFDRLDTLDGRFVNVSTQIGDKLLNVHTINVDGLPTPRWYQLDTAGAGANTVFASGQVFESATSEDFNASVQGSPVGGTATNPIGRMFFTWSSTDASNPTVSLRHQPRMKVGGRLASDSTTVSPGSTVATAPAAYNPVPDDEIERWGDYSAVTLDPNAASSCPVGQRAWAVNERNVNATVWGSRITRFGFC
jgi:hypothetical protein